MSRPILSRHPGVAEVREQSISIVIPCLTGEAQLIRQQMVLSTVMNKVNSWFEGVTLSTQGSKYKTFVSQGFCQQELLVKSWANQALILEHFEAVLDLASWAGQALKHEKMTVLIEGSGEQLLIRVGINTEQDQIAAA